MKLSVRLDAAALVLVFAVLVTTLRLPLGVEGWMLAAVGGDRACTETTCRTGMVRPARPRAHRSSRGRFQEAKDGHVRTNISLNVLFWRQYQNKGELV